MKVPGNPTRISRVSALAQAGACGYKRGMRLVTHAVVWLAVCLLCGQAEARTAQLPLADGFDMPVGKPDGEGYYVARGFVPNKHLGEDWNGVGGGDSDLGDPIYSIGHGMVVFARDVRLGWGNVVIIRHAYKPPKGPVEVIDSLYGHLQRIHVREGQIVRRGDQIGTMGNNRGMYSAHLHFEIRKNLEIGMNRADFKRDFSNYHDPRKFIRAHRRLQSGSTHAVALNTFRHRHGYYHPSDEMAHAQRTGNTRRTSPRQSVPARRSHTPLPGLSEETSRPDGGERQILWRARDSDN